jgi:UDP-2,4-diacetamido-2,4,6-trideoxy-beta-L-altropyranose hydrolase
LRIGIGHVMRCLTLADALKSKGATCQFICRAHEGNLIDLIRDRGHVAHALPVVKKSSEYMLTQSICDAGSADLSHAPWLGSTQIDDAQACALILASQRPDWLVVDHYALDANWERAMSPHYRRLMVIDDLADRQHVCDLLLDQTFGRNTADYGPMVPADCRLLCGSQFALLRPDFAALRPYSLQRRAKPALRELLISMGGVDKDNATGRVLEALRTCSLPATCRITVVMGSTAPWLDAVRKQALEDMPLPTRVLVGVSNMAQLMADSDLAIGAAGATSWERCCLGVPAIMLVLAENQSKVARGLMQAGGAVLLTQGPEAGAQLAAWFEVWRRDPAQLCRMGESAAGIVDGMGTNSVLEFLEA